MPLYPPALGIPVSVPNGGTGLATLTAHGVLLGEGTGNVVASSPGTLGQVFTSNGAGSDGAFAGPISKVYATALGSGGSISAALGTFANFGQDLALTASGAGVGTDFLITTTLRWSVTAATSGFFVAKLWDSLNSVFIAGSECLLVQNIVGGGTSTWSTPLTVVNGAPANIQVWVKRDGSGTVTGSIVSDTNGQSRSTAMLFR